MDFLKNLADTHQNSGDHHRPSAPERRQEDSDNLLERLTNKLNLSETPEPAPPAPKKPDNIFEKIGDVLKGEQAPPPPPPKPEGLLDKISDVLKGGKEEEPRKPETLGGKIGDSFNNVLGGGARGEAKEGHLDKAIDFVQEHVLKEGQQSNESALEQAKDGQIADAIRHGFKSIVGKDLPSSKKDSE